MSRESEIQKLVEDTLSCVDDIGRAGCPGTLVEKIRGVPGGKVLTVWDKAVNMFSKPMVAAACVALVIAADVILLKERDTFNTVASSAEPVSAGYATVSAALIDSENIQP